MKQRRHHNTKGLRQAKQGKTREQIKQIAKRLDIPIWSEQEICQECGGFLYKCRIFGHIQS